MSEADITRKLQNCFFISDEIEFAGGLIAPGQLEVAPKRTEASKGLSYPSYQTDSSEMKSFSGSSNVYRRFVPNFAKLTKLLTQNVTKGGRMRFELDDSEKEPVNKLKRG